MAEDWRVTVDLVDSTGFDLRKALRELKHEAKDELGDRIAVSASESQLFLYADRRQSAERAQRAVQTILDADGKTATLTLDRWHPLEERWESGDVPLPETAAERHTEHEVLEAQERADTAASGYAEWEVRIDLSGRHEAAVLQDALEAEGYGVTRRWAFLLIGTADEDEAHALAKRLRGELPDDASVSVEPGAEMFWGAVPGS